MEQIPNFNDDFGIVFGASINMEARIANSHAIVRRHIFNAKFILCGSPEYLAKFGIPKTPESLKNHSIIGHSRRNNPDSISLMNHEDVLLSPRFYLNDAYTMIKFAEQNMGLIQITDLYVRNQLKTGQLVEVLPKYAPPLQVFIYYRNKRHLDPKISKFIDFIFSHNHNTE